MAIVQDTIEGCSQQGLQQSPASGMTGANIEALKDNAGFYRYSLVWMFFNTAYSREVLISENGGQTVRSEVIARAVAVLNRFIDIYRVATNSAHVQRLSGVHVRDLFFQDNNIGFHGASFGHGIGTGVMNRSGAELNEIARKAATDEEIPLWDLLFLDAEASLQTNAFTLAVVNAFQALETASRSLPGAENDNSGPCCGRDRGAPWQDLANEGAAEGFGPICVWMPSN